MHDSSAHPIFERLKKTMADKSDGNEQALLLVQLQEHLTRYGEWQARIGVKLQSGQAEKLMCDLEAGSSGDCIDGLSLSAMAEQDEQLSNQARTQVMHENHDEDRNAPEPLVRNTCHRSTVQERSLTLEDATAAAAGSNIGALSPKPAKTNNDNSHGRNQRLKKMEGPANSAKELAKKLTYFTYYELLYLDDDASTDEIHAAYIKRTTDIRSRFRSGIEEWRLIEFIRALHEAHSVLTSSKLRQEYDSRLAAGNWEGTFQDLVSKIPDFGDGVHWSGSTVNNQVSLKDLLLCAGFVTQSELSEFGPTRSDSPHAIQDGPELAQVLADVGLITFEELASALLGKALIDRRQITVDQFKQAVGDMREHSHKLVDVLINQGWLTPAELHLIDID
jgi:hypothetical protein